MLFQGQKEYLKRCKDQNQHNNDINTDDDILMSTTSTTPMQQAQEKSYKQKPFWPQIVKTSVQSQQLQQQRNQYYDNSMAILALCQVCEKDLSHMDPTDVNEFQCMNCGKMLCGLCSFVNGDINCCFDCRDM